jgi:hypothetical protein
MDHLARESHATNIGQIKALPGSLQSQQQRTWVADWRYGLDGCEAAARLTRDPSLQIPTVAISGLIDDPIEPPAGMKRF